MPDALHHVAGQTLRLLPERALFWEEPRWLLAADLHLGKEGTFRSAGVPLPQGPSAATLQQLTQVIHRTQPTRLLILGDMFHGDGAVSAVGDSMTAWRQAHATLPMDLILGSHDRWSGELPATWDLTPHDAPLRHGPFLLAHYPDPVPEAYVLAGHLHPGVVLHDPSGGGVVRLPCFQFGEAVGILPAFGEFTGLAPQPSGKGVTRYVIAEEAVYGLPEHA